MTGHLPIPGSGSRTGAADVAPSRQLLRSSDGQEYRAELEGDAVAVGGTCVRVQHQADGSLRVDAGRAQRAWAVAAGDVRWVFIDGQVFVFETDRPASRRRRSAASHGSLTAPMPATVRKIVVSPGAAVRQGDVLIVLEAMKMELPVRAPGDGTVAIIKCGEGDLVQAGQELIELEP